MIMKMEVVIDTLDNPVKGTVMKTKRGRNREIYKNISLKNTYQLTKVKSIVENLGKSEFMPKKELI